MKLMGIFDIRVMLKPLYPLYDDKRNFSVVSGLRIFVASPKQLVFLNLLDVINQELIPFPSLCGYSKINL